MSAVILHKKGHHDSYMQPVGLNAVTVAAMLNAKSLFGGEVNAWSLTPD